MKDKSLMKKLSVLLPAGMLLITTAVSGCSNAGSADVNQNETDETMPSIPEDLRGGSPWMDSCIAGNVTADTETSAADDFYLYVNKDWIVSKELPEGTPILTADYGEEDRILLRDALVNDTFSEHDAGQAQLLFRAFTDTEARDASGCEPAKQVIDDLRSVSSIEELNAFLMDPERSAGVPSLIEVTNTQDYDEHRWITAVELSDSTFGSTVGTMGMDAVNADPESDIYRTRYELVRDVLTRSGWTDKEAEKAFEERLDLEKEIIRIAEQYEDNQSGHTGLTIDQLDSLVSGFPLRSLAETRGYGAAAEFRLYDESEIRAFAELYNEEHIDQLRSYLICGYVLEAGSWLDTKAFDNWKKDYDNNYGDPVFTNPERNRSIEETAVNLEAQIAPTLVGRAFVEAADLAPVKEFVTDLAGEAIEAHKENINASEWLSEESRQNLTGKLDAITLNLIYPEVWEDYSALELEGLDYYQMRRALWLNDLARNASLTGSEIDDRLWDSPSLFDGSGSYTGIDNSIRVNAGGVAGEVARYQTGKISLEELMGGITGYMLFHEIAHALDPADIYLDGQGNEVKESLITPADLQEYERRVDKIEKYFDGISIWEGQQVIGSVCRQEAYAEICGMDARLVYAAKQEGFDYAAFFIKRAQPSAALCSPEYALSCIMGADTHPSYYLDVNVTFQQFEEFNQTFGVKEGDGMYLAPEERLVIW